MNKGKVVRLAGFVGALGLSTVLVTTAIQGTGAYFSSSEAGTVTLKSGTVGLDITNGTSTTLNFEGVMPGVAGYQKKSIDYKVDASSGDLDLWMVFDSSAQFDAFTSAKGTPGTLDGGLGAYGYFAVVDKQGTNGFKSGNLAFPDDHGSPMNQTWPTGPSSCSVNANGVGGSDAILPDDAESTDRIPWCGVPQQILLRKDLQPGWAGTVDVTVGLNGYKNSAPTDQAKKQVNELPFKLVAIQAGHRPTV